MEKNTNLRQKWHEVNAEILRVEKTVEALKDISTFGGYKITFEKSTRGTAAHAKVELEAKFPGDISIAVEVMAEAISAYNTLLTELKKDLAEVEKMMNSSHEKCC